MGDSAVSQFPGFARESPIRERRRPASAVREVKGGDTVRPHCGPYQDDRLIAGFLVPRSGTRRINGSGETRTTYPSNPAARAVKERRG